MTAHLHCSLYHLLFLENTGKVSESVRRGWFELSPISCKSVFLPRVIGRKMKEGVDDDADISSSFFYLLLKIYFLSPLLSRVNIKKTETPVCFREAGNKIASVLWLPILSQLFPKHVVKGSGWGLQLLSKTVVKHNICSVITAASLIIQ